MPKISTHFCLTIVFTLALVGTTEFSSAQTLSVVHNFGAFWGDAAEPWFPGIIAQGRNGSLYTTTASGGNYESGAVFRTTTAGQSAVMYNFGGYFVNDEGSSPDGGLNLGLDGNFYGAAFQGGAGQNGTVFRITPAGSLVQLHDFSNTTDGSQPYSAPIQGTDGNWYGTTSTGGTYNYGTIYRLTGKGAFTVLHPFAAAEGCSTTAALLQGTDGNFYGTASGCGAYGNNGTVFKMTPAGNLTVLHSFNTEDGLMPVASLVEGNDGAFYGTTRLGGTNNTGTVFRITSTGHFKLLYNFCSLPSCADGSNPVSSLVKATDRNFYGVANLGGGADPGYGTIFQITPAGAFHVVYAFDGQTGNSPVTLMQHTNGLFYGSTIWGGTASDCNEGTCGILFSLDVSLKPFVTFVPQQSIAKIGASIGVLGQGFSGATNVSFGGVPATFKASSDTYLTATVPAAALTGSITVTTPAGTLSSNQLFRVQPQITSLSVTSGSPGTPVQINGAGLTQTSKVTFSGTLSTFTVNSDTQVTAIVPASATSGKIIVTTAGGTAGSGISFTITQ